MQLGNHQHRRAAGRRHIVAGIDLPQTDAAIDRRNDAAVSQVQLGTIDRRLVAGDGAFESSERGFQRVQVLLGDDSLLVQHLVAIVLGFRVGQLSFIFLQIGLGLRQRHLVGTRIDQDQQVAGFDVLAFLKIHLHDLAINAGLQ